MSYEQKISFWLAVKYRGYLHKFWLDIHGIFTKNFFSFFFSSHDLNY